MKAILLSNCSICLKDHISPLSLEECERLADPDCPQCQGSGLYEPKEDMIKRSIEQRACDDVLDKADAMDDAGLDYNKMSDEEFDQWTMEDSLAAGESDDKVYREPIYNSAMESIISRLITVKYPSNSYTQILAAYYQGYFHRPICLCPCREELQWMYYNRGLTKSWD